MAWGVRGATSNSQAGSSSPLNTTLADAKVNVGDLIWVGTGIRDSGTVTISSVTDDRGNSYALHRRHQAASQGVEQWTAIATNGGDTIVTVTPSGSCNLEVIIVGFSGAPASVTLVDSNGANAATAMSHPCGSVTGDNTDLLVTLSSLQSAFLATANILYTELVLGSRSYTQWKEPTGSFTNDAAWVSVAGEETTSCQIVLRDSALISGRSLRSRTGQRLGAGVM